MIQVLILFGEDEQCELMSKHAMLKPFSDISFQNMNITSMKHVQQTTLFSSRQQVQRLKSFRKP